MNTPQSEGEQGTSDNCRIWIGDYRVWLEKQKVMIEDTTDNQLIVLDPEKAERLRQWLAEVL